MKLFAYNFVWTIIVIALIMGWSVERYVLQQHLSEVKADRARWADKAKGVAEKKYRLSLRQTVGCRMLRNDDDF